MVCSEIDAATHPGQIQLTRSRDTQHNTAGSAGDEGRVMLEPGVHAADSISWPGFVAVQYDYRQVCDSTDAYSA